MKRAVVFTALLFSAAAGLLALASSLSAQGRLAPLWVLLPTTALAAFQLVLDAREMQGETGVQPETRRRQVRIVAWLTGLSLLAFLLGLLPAAAAFLFLFLRSEARTSASTAGVTAIATVTFLYLLFGVVGGIAFPAGTLF